MSRIGFDRFAPAVLLVWILALAWCFAHAEIQIEGGAGWAANLPTWRVERHWLLDVAWGGRPLTGYHAWVFSFMALAFHLPLALTCRFSWKTEARCLGSLMVFWILEDFFWFAFNPAFGVNRLTPKSAPWHVHWVLGLPTDYYTFLGIGSVLLWYSFRSRRGAAADPGAHATGA